MLSPPGNRIRGEGTAGVPSASVKTGRGHLSSQNSLGAGAKPLRSSKYNGGHLQPTGCFAGGGREGVGRYLSNRHKLSNYVLSTSVLWERGPGGGLPLAASCGAEGRWHQRPVHRCRARGSTPCQSSLRRTRNLDAQKLWVGKERGRLAGFRGNLVRDEGSDPLVRASGGERLRRSSAQSGRGLSSEKVGLKVGGANVGRRRSLGEEVGLVLRVGGACAKSPERTRGAVGGRDLRGPGSVRGHFYWAGRGL